MTEDLSEKRARELAAMREGLQNRIMDAEVSFAGKPVADVWRAIKKALSESYDEGLLANAPHEIHQFVPEPRKDEVNQNLVILEGGLVEGKKPFARLPEQARLKRDDDAWLHFTMRFRCATSGKRAGKAIEEVWAYDFELVFPEGHDPKFVRFDLNEPGHENANREIRCHLHPGNDDLLLPAPLMSPEELLDVLVRRLRARDPDKPRV